MGWPGKEEPVDHGNWPRNCKPGIGVGRSEATAQDSGIIPIHYQVFSMPVDTRLGRHVVRITRVAIQVVRT